MTRGLNFSLLRKTREELKRKQEASATSTTPKHVEKAKEDAGQVRFNTFIGRRVYEAFFPKRDSVYSNTLLVNFNTSRLSTSTRVKRVPLTADSGRTKRAKTCLMWTQEEIIEFGAALKGEGRPSVEDDSEEDDIFSDVSEEYVLKVDQAKLQEGARVAGSSPIQNSQDLQELKSKELANERREDEDVLMEVQDEESNEEEAPPRPSAG